MGRDKQSLSWGVLGEKTSDFHWDIPLADNSVWHGVRPPRDSPSSPLVLQKLVERKEGVHHWIVSISAKN